MTSAAQQYLYRLRPIRPAMLAEGATEVESVIVSRHFSYLQELTGRGVALLAGRTLNTDTSSFGIVVLAADSAEAARRIMEEDPAVAGGVMRAELFPFHLALVGAIDAP